MKFKYKLIFWDTVIFFKYKKDAEKYRDSLPYYQQEDATIIDLRKKEDEI